MQAMQDGEFIARGYVVIAAEENTWVVTQRQFNPQEGPSSIGFTRTEDMMAWLKKEHAALDLTRAKAAAPTA